MQEEGGIGWTTPGRGLAWQAGLLVVLSAACTRDDPSYRGPRDAAIDGGSGGDAGTDVPVRDGASGGTGGGTGGATGGSPTDARVDGRDAAPDASMDARPDGPDASPDARDGGGAGVGGGGRGGAGGAGGKGGGGGRGGNGGSAGAGLGGGAGNAQGGSAGGGGEAGHGGAAGMVGGSGGLSSTGGGGAGGSCSTMTAALAPTQVATFAYAPTRAINYDLVGAMKGNGTQTVAWFSFPWPQAFTGATLSAAQLRVVFDSVTQTGDLVAYTSSTTTWPTMLQVTTDPAATIDLTLAVSEKVTPASSPSATVFPLDVAALQARLSASQPLSLGLDGAGSVNAADGPSVTTSATGVSLQLTACTP